eukprot:13050374-Alexandrium_andersonii.AAC.1
MRALEGGQASYIDGLLAEVPVEQTDAGGQDVAQLLVVYVQRRAEPAGIGGRFTFQHGLGTAPQTHVEFV